MLLLYLGLLVAVTTVFCELAAKRDWIPYWVSRKILHVVAVGSCALAGYTADSLGHRELLTWIVVGAEVVLIALVGFGGLMREESGRRAWGIVWFPLAFLVLLVTTRQAEMIGFIMAILAVCDPAATVAGKVFPKWVSTTRRTNEDVLEAGFFETNKTLKNSSPWYSYQLTGDTKTLVGNGAFFICFALLVVLIPISYYYPADAVSGIPEYVYNYIPVPVLVVFGLVLTTGEALGSKGIDNLIIPLLAAYLFNILGPELAIIEEIRGVILGIIPPAIGFSYFVVKYRNLSLGGAVTASMLGFLIISGPGTIWLTPLLIFFISSSLIGKLFPSSSSASDAKQKLPRDATQVLANGAVYGLLAILWKHETTHNLPAVWVQDWPLLLLVTAATATADTWSSELGQYFRRPTWDLVKWRRVPAGLSGGVSWPGTLAGLGGAALIASLGWWLLPEPTLQHILVITGFGFLGMLLDSVLGSLFQAAYRDPATGTLSDVCPEGGELASGFPGMTNDLVNFLAIALTALVAGLVVG